jgi:thioredoxin-like negative regulator of GroEL
VIEVTDERDLAKQLKANQKVVALFHSSWCPFCRSFLSVFNKHAQNPGSGSAVFMRVKIDEDENPMWESYSLMAVPSIILFENGEVSQRLDCELGAGLNEKQFVKWLGTI